MTSEEKSKIQNLCFQINLKGKYEQEAVSLAEERGADFVLKILKDVSIDRSRRRSEGLQPTNVVGAFHTFVRNEKQRLRREVDTEKVLSDNERFRIEYEASVKRGYVPSQEAIKNQIEDLLDRGSITQSAYREGMVGLQYASTLVALMEAKRLAEEEEQKRKERGLGRMLLQNLDSEILEEKPEKGEDDVPF